MHTVRMASDVFCSYCLRSRSETGPLMASPLATICRACAENAISMFASQPADESDLSGPAAPWRNLRDDELLARLPEVAAAGLQVEAHLKTWVDAARDRGLSWARIGEALGMTRQSAWERFTSS